MLSLCLRSGQVIAESSAIELGLFRSSLKTIYLGEWPVGTAFKRTALVRVGVSANIERMLLWNAVDLRIWSSDEESKDLF